MENFDFETCMDIFDWFDDAAFEYLNHIILSKVDGEKRVRRALPELQKKARWLVALHRDTEGANPVEFLDQPA